MNFDIKILAELSFSKFLLLPGDEIAATDGDIYTQHQQGQQWRQIRIGERNLYGGILELFYSSNLSVLYKNIDSERKVVEKVRGIVIKDFVLLTKYLMDDPDRTFGFLLAYSRANNSISSEGIRVAIPSLVVLEAAHFLHLFDRNTPFAAALRDAEVDYSKRLSNFENFISEKNKEIEVLEQTYADKLKLEEASAYFDSKANSHKFMSIGSFSSILSIILVGCLILYINFYNVFEFITLKPGIKNEHVYIFALIGTIFFGSIAWVIRLLSRIYNQNLLLWSDARQRSVFLRTYLSLRQRGGVSPDERERVLVLNAIFRPVGDQKDEDIAPPSLLDFLPKK